MTHPAVQIFNLLHDGRITSVSGSVPGDITLEIACDYLRERIKTPGDRFIVKLGGCSKLIYEANAPNPEARSLEELASLNPWILSAEQQENSIIIYTGPGQIHLECVSAQVFASKVAQLSIDELSKIAKEYWDKF